MTYVKNIMQIKYILKQMYTSKDAHMASMISPVIIVSLKAWFLAIVMMHSITPTRISTGTFPPVCFISHNK